MANRRQQTQKIHIPCKAPRNWSKADLDNLERRAGEAKEELDQANRQNEQRQAEHRENLAEARKRCSASSYDDRMQAAKEKVIQTLVKHKGLDHSEAASRAAEMCRKASRIQGRGR